MTPREAELTRRVAELEDELRCWRDLGRQELRQQRIRALRRALGLSPQKARLLLALHDASGRYVSEGRLADALDEGRKERKSGDQIVKVYVCLIRRRLGKDAVLNSWGEGYALSPAGLAAVREALATVSEVAA